MDSSDFVRFDAQDQRWHVESLVASRSFGVGDQVTEAEVALQGVEGNPNNPYRLPLGFTARTTDDARRMALAFAGALMDDD